MLWLTFVAEVYDSNLNLDAFLAHISKLYKNNKYIGNSLVLKETRIIC